MDGRARRVSGLGAWLPRRLRAPGRDAVRLRHDLEKDLHDGAAAGMSALALELGLISMAADDPGLGARIDAAQGLLRRVLDDLRGVGTALYPPMLVSGGLAPALRTLAEHRNLRLRLDLPGEELRPETRSRVALLVADHLHTLCAGSVVRIRVRGRRLIRVRISDKPPGLPRARQHRAVLRCG
ncbi:MAG TPA: histidine kinase [Actinophytocola sp.]|jgi:signal transduction histidine kinase|nr:histidine kinase [Actinophytocola sp.]